MVKRGIILVDIFWLIFRFCLGECIQVGLYAGLYKAHEAQYV